MKRKIDHNTRVSVLIPLYNAATYIGESIQSALDQTWPHIEVIVVDDGSTDNSFEAAQAYESDQVKVYQQENAGATFARNKAFRHATGDYIQYLDADDLLAPDKIEQQLKLLKDESPETISSCSWGRFYQTPDDAQVIPEKVWQDYPKPIDWLIDAFEGGGMMQTACWLTPRSLIERSEGWNTSMMPLIDDDGEFFSRIMMASEGIVFSKQAIVYYRSGLEQSLSQNHSSMAVDKYLKTINLYENLLLAAENSPRTRHACMRKYQSFVYLFHPQHPALLEKAFDKMKALGFKGYEPIGGSRAKWLTRLFGFKTMLKMRQWFSR